MIISNLPPLLKNQTCAITGHRILGEDFDFNLLKSDLVKLIGRGFNVFLIGMAQGFDLTTFKALSILKKDFPEIRLCAVIPCSDQSKYFSAENRYDYYEFIESADFIAKEENPYFKGCMLLRNNYLIDNCSLCYAYFNGEKHGGTYYTIKRAINKGIRVDYYGEIK